MTADRWPLVKGHFAEALALPEPERPRFLDALDAYTRSEVEALLDAADSGTGPLDLPFDTSLLGFNTSPFGFTTDIVDRPDEDAGGGNRLAAGTRVGPYVIEERIGRGGMGDVYRARRADGLFERDVALKVVRANTEAVLARFAAERRILGTLEHPGIARLIAAGAEHEGPTAGRPWLALELVDGMPLTGAVGGFPLEERLRLLIDVAEAVHHAHRRLIVHRDLKPSNVLVTEDEHGAHHIKLLDFGIAKIVDPEADLGLTQFEGQSPRTRAYAAPEQVSGDPVTTATDVYGLGLLLFEVLAAARPFPIDRSVHALELAILGDDPPALSAATQPELGGVDPKLLRGDLDAICRTALAKEPERRYASAEAFAADLRRFLSNQPVEARAPSAWYRMRRFVARHTAGVAAAALVLLSLTTGLGLALWQARAAEAARSETQLALDEAETALARAEAVTEFLRSLFTANDPTTVGGDTLTTMDLLALGAERAEEMTDDPHVQAQVLLTVGLTYGRIEQYAESTSLLRRALAIREQTLGPRHPDVATARHYLGETLFDHVEFGDADAALRDEAETLFRDALAIRRETLETPHLDIAASLERLGAVRLSEGDYDRAEAYFREAIAVFRALPTEDVGEFGYFINTLTNSLAMTLYWQGAYEAAEPVAREALDLYRETYGEEHYYTVAQMTTLGRVLQARGKLAEAESVLVRALDMDRELLGDDHVFIAIDVHNVADVLHDRGDTEAAERLFRDALARFRAAVGNDHPRVATTLHELSLVHAEREEYAEAEALLHEALAIRRAAFEDPNPHIDETRAALVALYEAWGKLDEATRYRDAETL